MNHRIHSGVLTAFALVALPVVASAGGTDTVRRLDDELAAGGARRVSIEAPVGEFRIEGAATTVIEVSVELRCERPVEADCRRKAEGVVLATGTDGDTASVEVRGWPKHGGDGLSLSLSVTVPRDLPLDGEFGVGELTVGGIEAGARVELGVGEIGIEAPAASVRRVDLEVGVGEASLHVGGRRIDGKGFLGREIDWNGGRGRGEIVAECGVGEIEVRLTD